MISRSITLRTTCRLALFAMLSLGISSAAVAHPGHVTSGEAEYNAKTRTLEVAIEVDPDDLETALRSTTGKRIVLEKSDDVDQHISKYLKQCFSVTYPDKKLLAPTELKWVGKEIEPRSAWLYFEIPLSEGIEGMEISHRLFLEEMPGQINTLRIRSGKRRTTLRFTEKTPSRLVAFDNPSDKKEATKSPLKKSFGTRP